MFFTLEFSMMILGVDTETTGTTVEDFPFAVSMSLTDGTQWWWEWPVDSHTLLPKIPKNDKKEIKEILNRADLLVFHNALFDIPKLEAIGIKFTKAMWKKVRDTLAYSHLFKSTKPHDLKHLAWEYMDIPRDDQVALLKQITADLRRARQLGWNVKKGSKAIHSSYWLPKAINSGSTLLEEYGREDAYRTVCLWKFFEQTGTFIRPELIQREMDLIPIVADMEQAGATLLPEKLNKQIKKWEKDVINLTAHFKVIGFQNGFESINPASPKQVADLIYNKLGYTDCLETTPKTKTGYSTESGIFKQLSIIRTAKGLSVRGLNELIQYRQISKALGSLKAYRKSAVTNGNKLTLHTRYNPWGTGTTRFTSKEENLQNVSNQSETNVRGVFGPTDDKVWYALDYSQMELRILAYLSQEPILLQAFAENIDIHQQTADVCNITRKLAKSVNFGIIYGGGNKLLEKMTGVEGLSTKFFNAHPMVKQFFRNNTEQARRRGWVETAYKYRLYTPEERPYAATDYVIQGTAGDTLKYSLVEIWKYIHKKNLQKSVRMIMMIHDELIFEVSKTHHSLDLVRALVSAMEKPSMELENMYLPVDASIVTSNWADAQELEL